jgi:hypothetical protein
MACKQRHECSDILQQLLAYPNIDVNAQDADGRTALHMANCRETVSLLLSHPDIDPCVADKCGQTPLGLFVQSSHTGRLRQLLTVPGLDVHAPDKVGYSPLQSCQCLSARQVLLGYLSKDPRQPEERTAAIDFEANRDSPSDVELYVRFKGCQDIREVVSTAVFKEWVMGPDFANVEHLAIQRRGA